MWRSWLRVIEGIGLSGWSRARGRRLALVKTMSGRRTALARATDTFSYDWPEVTCAAVGALALTAWLIYWVAAFT